jgi:serine protease AprX
MIKFYCTASLVLLFTVVTEAQHTRHIIELKNKNGTAYTLSNPSAYLSAKAIERRTRYKIAIDSTDLPVTAAYLDSIRSVPNVTILNVSKWLNQVAVRTNDPAALTKIAAFPFVKSSAPIGSVNRASGRSSDKKQHGEKDKKVLLRTEEAQLANSLNYGNSFNQVHMHEGEYLHNLGFSGQGMTIALLDAGFFAYKTNPAFDSLRLQNRILGEWDFVANQQSVNEDDAHGMYCLSTLAANRPGVMVGTAPHAKYYLYRTEDAPTEFPIEEQNWAAAAERADSLGVDMISSSLGYTEFDDHSFDHSHAERNGNTTIITRAADLAAKKGILVMNSAGNSGAQTTDLKYVAAPADGDSVFTVGAVDINGNIATFSSWGPNGAGRVKPNVVSLGVGTTITAPDGSAQSGNGTSFSNPNLAGLVACLWQAYPEFNNMEIIDAVQRSASRYTSPDNRYGYGIPNFRKAAEILEQIRAGKDYQAILKNDWIRTYPIPFKDQLQIVFKAPASGKASIRLIDATGRTLEMKTLEVSENSFYSSSFNNLSGVGHGVYFVQYLDGKNSSLLPVIK